MLENSSSRLWRHKWRHKWRHSLGENSWFSNRFYTLKKALFRHFPWSIQKDNRLSFLKIGGDSQIDLRKAEKRHVQNSEFQDLFKRTSKTNCDLTIEVDNFSDHTYVLSYSNYMLVSSNNSSDVHTPNCGARNIADFETFLNECLRQTVS